MHAPKHDERGLVGVVLTIVIVFALVAVVQLTRTLEAAQQINTTVKDITGSVKGANQHLSTGCDPAKTPTCPAEALPVLSTTEGIVVQINDAAKPLSAQAGQVLNAVNSINTTASAILATASSINGTVHSIGSSAGSINASVNSIGASINGVNSAVTNIQQGVVGINQRADTIISLANGVKRDTGSINSLAGGILGQAQGICGDSLKLLTLQVLKVC